MPAAPGKGSIHVIIDGYNLIRNVPALAQYEGRSLQDGRDHLIARAASYRAATGHRVTVVFDGPAPSRDSRRGVAVCYAQPADDDIIRRAGPGCVVVSSDHAVADGARARGADTMRSDEFWDIATSKHPGVAAPNRRSSRKGSGLPDGAFSGGYDKDEDDEEPERPGKRGPSKRLSRSEREAEERRRRLRNLM